MATYVLVHGAFVGGWYWRDFAALLRSKGHEVYPPTLTGLGERVHLMRPETNLSTHIQDVINVIEYEDLHDIILVGHSYGGMVITGAADQLPERIAHLVYVDAVVPSVGQAMADGGPGGRNRTPPSDGRIPPPADPISDSSRRRHRWVGQPVGTFVEPIELRVPPEKQHFKLTFVRALQGAQNAEPGASRARNDARWSYVELPCGHNVHREMPNELAAILLQLA